MAVPKTRAEFKQYCLRKLGHPVIEINVDDDQVDDRIDEALQMFADYYFDGTSRVFYKHLITQTDIDNKYITLPENIVGAVQVYPASSIMQSAEYMFNIEYQFVVNELYTFTSYSLVPYYMNLQHLSLIEEILVGEVPIRYNRHTDKLHLDFNWHRVSAGEYFLVDAYEVVDPEEFTDVWSDRWLQNYATALIKEQWGSNITKFSGMVLPGGVQFNGERILSDAQRELEQMRDEIINKYSLPPNDFYG